MLCQFLVLAGKKFWFNFGSNTYLRAADIGIGVIATTSVKRPRSPIKQILAPWLLLQLEYMLLFRLIMQTLLGLLSWGMLKTNVKRKRRKKCTKKSKLARLLPNLIFLAAIEVGEIIAKFDISGRIRLTCEVGEIIAKFDISGSD